MPPNYDEQDGRDTSETRAPTAFSNAVSLARLETRLTSIDERVKRIETALYAIAATAGLALIGAILKLVIK